MVEECFVVAPVVGDRELVISAMMVVGVLVMRDVGEGMVITVPKTG